MGKKIKECNTMKNLKDEIHFQNQVNDNNIFIINKITDENYMLKMELCELKLKISP